MIGVIADPEEHGVVSEFFELFKTPWEFFREDHQYEVLLTAGDQDFPLAAKLVIVYAGRKTRFDSEQGEETFGKSEKGCFLLANKDRIPIYGESISFAVKTRCLLRKENSQECAAYLDEAGGILLARIGYDLFAEIRTLLTEGQPRSNARIPTLELHIEYLRRLITDCGIALCEIPPVPDGFQFLSCLTHDVDHPAIRQHKWDHTVFGFLYRATFDSVRRVCRRQLTFRGLLMNWSAVLKLPFVYLGLAKDFWCEFTNGYRLLEQGFHSTFFIIPFKNRPGISPGGAVAPPFRGSSYGAQDIAALVRKLVSEGHEVGLHGIDAWADSSRGREELEEIRRFTANLETGVRMHWLYLDQKSCEVLEQAGASYDSTFGYNEDVGYRAGTTQAYKPLQATRLLELPLHVMDTALFYPSRLELTSAQASEVIDQMLDNTVRFGGVLTVNWHDRSIVPERLWGVPYRTLLANMQLRGAWISTAGQAVAWFRKRRSAKFIMDLTNPGTVHVKVHSDQVDHFPALKLRTYGKCSAKADAKSGVNYIDTTVEEKRKATVFTGIGS